MRSVISEAKLSETGDVARGGRRGFNMAGNEVDVAVPRFNPFRGKRSVAAWLTVGQCGLMSQLRPINPRRG